MADDKSALLDKRQTNTESTTTWNDPLYYDSSQSPKSRLIQVLFVVVVVVMVLITISLSLYQGVKLGDNGGLYFMLGIALIGFVMVDLFLILFIRRGDLPEGKTWFLYFVGSCVILEAIFTDILLFQ